MRIKRLGVLLAATVCAFSMVACGTGKKAEDTTATEANTPATVTITSLNGNKEEISLEVPYNPQKIAILDLASLDIIDSLGMGDRVVGTADTSIDYLKKYADNKNIKNLGTIKEADMEAVMECEPDVIFIGGRLAASYDALSEIAPVVFLATDTQLGVVKSVTKNATTIAKMFGLESQVDSKVADFNKRIEALSAVAKDKTALVGMTTSGSFNLLGNDGRCSIIGVEIGFNNLTASSASSQGSSEKSGSSEKGGNGSSERGGNGGGRGGNGGSTSTHGNESSFETVVAQNPDYIFVMDRDSAIGTQGAKMAKEIMENDLVKQTDAYKNNRIVYLEHPNVWYTAEGGIQALDTMLKDLEKSLLNK